MNGIKKYKVHANWYDNTEIEVTIDFDKELPCDATQYHADFQALIKESSMFWSGSPSRDAPIEEHLHFFLKVLANSLIWKKAEGVWNDEYIIKTITNDEGFFPLDGSWGVTVDGVCSPMDDLSSDDFEVEQINK